MDLILQKETGYTIQMDGVRRSVFRFLEGKGWATQGRGRRAHVSVFGPVNGLDGVIDIEMEETDWHKAPESLQPHTPFLLWCSAAVLAADRLRLFSDTELFWRAPFASLLETVNQFLPQAWDMLNDLSEANLLREWPGPARNPDDPPNFGPPRRRGAPR